MNKHAAPEFAMSFTQEAVLLERRDGLGWNMLGQVRFAAGNLGASLRDLRDEASTPDDSAETLLVIPDDQILYTRLTVSPGADLRATIARALEGMTPYRAEELVFDWCPDTDGKIDSLRVAVVAQKTLEEAEEFARLQGFEPAGFTARPEDERFDGQPDFGLSRMAQDLVVQRPFSKPDLHQAAITSDRIEIVETQAETVTISRITPHYVASAHGTIAAPVDAAAPSVIRHGDRRAASDKMSERARAFHARAAAARATQDQTAEDAPAATGVVAMLTRLQDRMPGTLGVMLAGLGFLLLVTLVFFGAPPATAPTEDQPTQIASAPAEPAEQAPVATPAPAPDARETAVEPQPAATAEVAPAPQPPVEDALTAALDEALAAAEAPATAAAVDPAPVDPTLVAAATAATGLLNATPAAPQPQTAEETPPEAATPESVQKAATTAPAIVPLREVSQSLSRSARPPKAPAPARTAQPSAPDARPAVPANPQPYAQRTQPEPARVTGLRPPSRPAAPATPASPAAEPASSDLRPARPAPQAVRPPSRPQDLSFLEEGSAAEEGQPTRLTQAERASLEQLLRDLRTAQAGDAGFSKAERGAVFRLAQARPLHKPLSISGPSRRAVEQAVDQAVSSSDRPEAREDAAPASRTDAASLAQSVRPAQKPRSGAGSGSASLSRQAVEGAIASAVENSSAGAGAVALTALRSSALPPRPNRSQSAPASAPAAPAAPSADDLRQAAEEQRRIEEQRRNDAELQAQAEARARARAAEDARAEAQARAQAEARARAQAEAEARAAASRKQNYAPPEAEKEPEIASTIPEGRTAASVAAAATVKDGIHINRTQIIGTIGAGKASRALVRLSNGRVLTLRLGDKINGGTITAIGDSRITYSKGGRSQQLSVLNGQ